MAGKDPLILDFTNGRVFADADLDECYASGLDDDEQPANWDDIDLEDMFDLPPVLPPIRLPDEAELAVRARRSALLTDLRFEQEQYREFMGTSGTHSIIDVGSVVPADFAGEEFGTIRPLSEAEYLGLFGVSQPGRADYTALANSEQLDEYVTGGRWTGRAAVLWADGAPAEIAF